MQTLTIEVTNQSALEALHTLEERHLIKIIGDTDLDSVALPGNALSLEAFKNWITRAESTGTVSLHDAKEEWASKRKKLAKLIT